MDQSAKPRRKIGSLFSTTGCRAATPRSARQCSWEMIGWCGFPWGPFKGGHHSTVSIFVPGVTAPLKSSYAIFCCWRCSKMKQVDETGKKYTTDSAHPSFWSTTFLQQRTKSVEIPREPLADPQQENQHFQGLPDVKAIQVSWEEWPAPVTTYPSVPPLPPPTSWWRPRTAPNIGKTWLE